MSAGIMPGEVGRRAAANAARPPRLTHEDAVLAAMCAIRHARSVAEAETFHDMLGIDPPPAVLNRGGCDRCGYRRTSPKHQRLCGRT